jgi:sensor domain CHASE-containing protein
MVKEFIEVGDCTSLDALIENLIAVRESLPNPADAKVKMRGDDVFGRQISVSFFRPQTIEEAEVDARYVEAYRESRQRELDRLQAELGVVCHPPRGRSRNLRIVA